MFQTRNLWGPGLVLVATIAFIAGVPDLFLFPTFPLLGPFFTVAFALIASMEATRRVHGSPANLKIGLVGGAIFGVIYVAVVHLIFYVPEYGLWGLTPSSFFLIHFGGSIILGGLFSAARLIPWP